MGQETNPQSKKVDKHVLFYNKFKYMYLLVEPCQQIGRHHKMFYFNSITYVLLLFIHGFFPPIPIQYSICHLLYHFDFILIQYQFKLLKKTNQVYAHNPDEYAKKFLLFSALLIPMCVSWVCDNASFLHIILTSICSYSSENYR